MTTATKRPVQIRISSADLAEVDRLAEEAGLTRSEYIRRAALGIERAHLRQALRRVAETAHDALQKGAR